MEEFIHPALGERVEFFGGGYFFVEEETLAYCGEKVLYLKGVAAIESSCCGPGGCGFIKVPGYIRTWKNERNEKGRPVSRVERIESPDEQREIRRILRETHPGFTQVEFF